MFGLPSLERIIMLGTVPIMIGFAMVNYKQTWYSVMAFVAICLNTWYGIWFYLAFMYQDFKRTEDSTAVAPVPVREKLLYRDMSDPTYKMSVPAVAMDVERNFASRLLSLFRSGGDYKLTEKWLWDTGLWQEIGGSSKKQLQQFLKDWQKRGLLKKHNPLAGNSTRRVVSWKRVSDIAQGRG